MMMPALPPKVICAVSAAVQYQVPANVLLAIAEQEGGKPGQWVANRNATYDVGIMQFNTAYLKTLRTYGITPEAVAANNCYPYQLAAWRIRESIKTDQGDFWTRAANYHSHTPSYNQTYRMAIRHKAAVWQTYLMQRFATKDLNLTYFNQLIYT